ncbi:MAG TPA: hypothetical protein PJ991_05800 [Kiritimatiellia bacterium]|nr:hypothetical protein [Kiritimatiellia bacterium]
MATEADFAALEPGDKIALVCKQGNVIHCPQCKFDFKVTRKGHPAGKGSGAGLQEEVVIVNANGEPCMFYSKIK